MPRFSGIIKNHVEIISVSAAILLAYAFNEAANNISALILIISGIGLFIYCGRREKNLFSFSGLICAGFLGPLGLALLRLSAYQIPWLPATWLCFWLAPVCFLLGRKCAPGFLNWLDLRWPGRVLIERAERRPRLLFFFGLGVFALALITMLIKWQAGGFLPFFADRAGAYLEFMLGKGHSAPAGLSSMYLLPELYNLFLRRGPFALYQLWLAPSIMMIYGLKANRPMKVVCGAVGLAGVLITMLILSRDIYIMTMVCLTVTAYFCLSRKKLIAVLVLFAFTLAGYYVMSNARGLSNAQLKSIFEIGETKTSRPGRARTYVRKAKPDIAKNLPSVVVWSYSYFTCALDNFDYLVEVNDRFYYGLAQIRPLLVVLRMKETYYVSEAISNNPAYNISPAINIHSFLKEPYVDFGVPGVAFSLFFWGLVCGAVEAFFLRFRGRLSLLGCASLAHHLIFVSLINWAVNIGYLFPQGLLCILFFFIYDFKKGEKGE